MQFDDYRSILRRELELRCKINQRYSMRAFARDLGLASARLSLILNKKQGLSEATAKLICRKLGYSGEDADLFCQLVLASDSRSKIQRSVARSKVNSIYGRGRKIDVLQEDVFAVIAEWYHYAILELTLVKGFRSDVVWISRRLGISRYETEEAISRLRRLGMLKEVRNRYVQSNAILSTTNDIPSQAIKNFTEQTLRKAMSALHMQSLEERDLSTLTIALGTKDLPRIKERLREFRRELNHSIEKTDSAQKDEVYMFSMQLFRLSEKDTEAR